MNEIRRNEAKEFLNSVRLYDTQINNKLEEIHALKTMLTKITTTLKEDAGSGSGGNSDKIGNAVAKLVDIENALNADIDAFLIAKDRVNALINQINDPVQLRVLHLRYFEYRRWEAIADELHMVKRNVQYIHGRALQTVNKLMKEEQHE